MRKKVRRRLRVPPFCMPIFVFFVIITKSSGKNTAVCGLTGMCKKGYNKSVNVCNDGDIISRVAWSA